MRKLLLLPLALLTASLFAQNGTSSPQSPSAPMGYAERKKQELLGYQRGIQGMFPDVVFPVIGRSWPCTPTAADLPRLIRILDALDDENTPDSMVNTYSAALMRAKGVNIGSRNALKVIKTTPGLRLVQVIETKPMSFSYQRETAKACWIVSGTIGAAR